MELLGNYQSQLTNAYYQELLALLNTAISQGDLASGTVFDQSNLTTLELEAQSFASLPTGSANSRVTDDSLNYPLSLLQARLNALQTEADSFTSVSGRLLQIIYNETNLIDQLLAADNLNQYISSLPRIADAWTQAWDFSISEGSSYSAITNVDPSNSVEYNNSLGITSVFNTSNSILSSGLVPPSTVRSFPPKYVSWTYGDEGTTQALYAPDFTWTQLDIITNEPNVQFSPNPEVQIILPVNTYYTGGFDFIGSTPGGMLPTYVRLLFYPRNNSITVSVTNGQPTALSAYNIDPNVLDLFAVSGSTAYTLNSDFTILNNTIIPSDIGTDVQVIAYFTEYWPAYQCSLDQTNWSPIIMIDPSRLYPDDSTVYLPVDLYTDPTGNIFFPVIDQDGNSSGVYFKLIVPLSQEYTLLVTTPTSSVYNNESTPIWGPKAVLEIDVNSPAYMNTISFTPYCALPMTLIDVSVEGLTANTLQSIWSDSFLLEESIQINFTRQIVSKFYLTLAQNNYIIKEYQLVSADALRRNIMNSIEAALPLSISNSTPATPKIYRGYQYEWGLENITALDILYSLPGVFVQGPYTINGCPDVLRFDAVVSGTVSIYLVYSAYSSTGELLDSNIDGFLITPGTAVVFPFTGGVTRANINSVKLGLRFVLRTDNAVVSRFLLQGTIV